MRKTLSVLITAIVVLISTLVVFIPSTSVEADGSGDYPPPSDVDWIIWNDTYVGNETLIIEKNITVMGGATLVLQSVTLQMNSTTSTGDNNRIEVLSGGTLIIRDGDGDNTTTTDASRIMRNDPNYGYLFTAWAGSTLRIYNSIIDGCGRISSPLQVRGGIYVETDDAIIEHSIISNGTYYGIVLYNSDAVVSNNTIEWNDIGIRATTWSNGTIENNFIAWNEVYGIWVDGWDNTVKRSSNPLIRNNLILESGRGTFVAVGIQVTAYSNPFIIDNMVINSTEDGIYLGQWCQAVLINNTFESGGGNYGIASSAPRYVNITNCTVTNTALYDLSLSQAYFILINTTFNKSKVKFWDISSNLTVRWFLHTFIKDNYGNPVQGATVRVRDNANGTYDQNVTTDVDGWARWIVVTEKVQNKSGNLSFTSHNITVTKSGYFEGFAEPNMNQSKYITITLQADEPPTADAGPDQSVNEDEQVTFDGSGSTDDVGIVWYNWTFGDGNYDYGTNITTNYTYTNAGTYIITLNVTDTIGQWDEDTALVFVNNVGPTADAVSNQIVDEGESVLFDASNSTDTPSDQSNLIYTWYFGDGDSNTGINVTHVYIDDGNYNVTLIVTDDNGFVDSNTTIVTVNNVAPVIDPVPFQTIEEDSLFTIKINATDVPTDKLTFSDNTTLFDIDPITGLIEFTPTNDDVGNHSVNITVVDDDGGVNYTILNITVVNTNDAPVIESISQQSAIEDVEFTLQVDASDVDVGDVLTYSLTTYPPGMSIDGVTGVIFWTPTNDDVGTHTVTVKVEDAGGLYDTETFTIVVSNVNDAPTIITSSLADATEDVFYMAYIQAGDIDTGDSLTYSLDYYPAFLSINPLNGMIFGTPRNDDVGTYDVIVNVTDGDVYVTKTFILNVVNVNDASVIASSPIMTAEVGVEYSYDVVAVDEDNDVLTFSLIEGPDGMIINGTKITWTPTNEQQGETYQVVVEVSDGDITATQSFVVSVSEIPEKTNYWPSLLLGLIGGLISGVIITWLLNQRKKEELE